MRTKSVILFLLIFFTVQMNSQVRKPIRSKKNVSVEFEFKEGIQKIMIPGTKSFLSILIKGRNPKLVRITRTTKGKSYRLKKIYSSNYRIECACNSTFWEDPYSKLLIGICEPCKADEDELSGQIEFLGPDM